MSEGARSPASPGAAGAVGNEFGLSRRERFILGVGLVATSFAVAMTLVMAGSGWVRFWDNVHWTVSYGTAFSLAFLARKRASGVIRRVRHWFMLSLGALFFGQLLWDLQVWSGFNPFPGPSDALFVSMGPLAIVATLQFVQGQSRPRRLAVALDGLGFLLSVLALALSSYLPRRGTTDALTLTVMVAYPTALLTATMLFLVALFEIKKGLTFGAAALGLGLLAHGLLWSEWNLATLEGRLGDGKLLNFLYSYATLVLGFGVAACQLPKDEVSVAWARVYRLATRSLPPVFVVAAGVAVALSLDASPPVRFAVHVCMAGVIVVAVLRQSLLLEEGERLLEAEAQYRLLSERIAASQRLEALGTLASGIAHDFNNLLTAILGHSELLRGRQVGEREEESVEAVRAAAVRARGVVQRVLAFSRQQALEKEPVDASALVDEVRALLQAALPARHHIEVSAERLGILASAAQIHQVLMNLGTNASHAIGERAGTIRFRVSRQGGPSSSHAGSGQFVEIAVTDNGVGMDDATRERMFEPFFTTKGREQGTGLGLSVAHGIVSEHGGSIRVDSALGRGTTVTLLLPEVDLAKGEALREKEAIAPVRASGREILVIDDEKVVADVMVRMLRRFGQTPVAFDSPEEAVAAVVAAPSRFWLVITDMSMPSMSGEAAAEQLRRAGYQGKLVLSSGTDFVVAGTPFDDVLPKPYEITAVRALLARHGEGTPELSRAAN